MKSRAPLLVSAGIIHRDGQILVGQRRRADRHPLKWEFPGGKVEAGETPQQALVRELREELRIEATVGTELARYEHEYPSGSRVHLLFFAIPAFTGEVKGQVFEQIQWVDVHRLPSLDFLDGDFDFVRRLARGDFKRVLK
jgi:8-oxo-dGTP diphosphatase